MPLLYAKKEVFEWLKSGQKTIDIRKGKPQRGEIAVFQSGPYSLRLKIVARESGKLKDVVRHDNYKFVIPTASSLEDAVAYFFGLYANCDGVFTAYHVAPLEHVV
jgi:ASC-1-like (ASCH) protein